MKFEAKCWNFNKINLAINVIDYNKAFEPFQAIAKSFKDQDTK